MRTTALREGLTDAEAALRLARDGPNELPRPPRRSAARRVLAQLTDPLVLVLLVVAAVTTAIGDHADTAVVLLVVLGNTTVGVVQEIRADRSVEALDRLGAARARVRRDGAVRTVPAREVVGGDVLAVAAGDVLAADGTVLWGESLQLDEAAITGESLPVEAHRPGTEVLSGSVVTRGRGEVLVGATGPSSAMGRIAEGLVRTRSRRTPLQQQLAALGRWLALTAVVACAVVFALGLLRGEPPVLMLVTALSLAVAAVPESLPVVVTLGLALGARRMADRHAVARSLPAVETLGAVTLLATDKTGTLTEGRLRVAETWTEQDLDELARAAVLCNDAPAAPDADAGPGTDPLEAALVDWARSRGIDVAAVRGRHPRRAAVPFDAVHRRMTTWHDSEPDDGPDSGTDRGADATTGGVLVVEKGAPETVLPPPGLSGVADRARRWAEDAATRGLRVIVVATGRRSAVPVDADADVPHDLDVLGVLALRDQPREAARDALAGCHRAGIRTVVLTGDHPGTAATVAAQVGLTGPGGRPARVAVPDGAGHDGELLDADVVARCRPERKLDVVAGWQSRGEVVAMTGDGVNDGPALRRADIGVAMGRRGTEVARQAADLVLADDDLNTVVAAVDEGRRIHTNVRRFLAYALAGGLAEVLVMLTGPLIGVALPLLPGQILWINLLTHGLPGVAFGAEPSEPGAMATGPRRPGASVLAGGLWIGVLVVGAVVAALTVATLVLVGDPEPRSAAFVALGLAQLGVAVGLRARRPRGTTPAGPDWLLIAVGGAALAQVAAVTVAPLMALLRATTPTPLGFAAAVGGAVVAGLVARLLARPRVIGEDRP
ncbi:cation-translocating P-type ATPase [Actinomycetospora straminea]|uniref:Cation-translocating P-type ATPase n=1 Tax=Actinomycetospora straminea TaxID=663607 RepID=A0ABP9EKS3_9PSEU|nr:cation-translocating P-type ATPase [Actinomycetospora straminea]MDD7933165.1 cation-translocating P-type ATPase [Actinomycetospora straminea]